MAAGTAIRFVPPSAQRAELPRLTADASRAVRLNVRIA
jgi:hypothetical protein